MTNFVPYVAAFEVDRRTAEYYPSHLQAEQQIGCMQGGGGSDATILVLGHKQSTFV